MKYNILLFIISLFILVSCNGLKTDSRARKTEKVVELYAVNNRLIESCKLSLKQNKNGEVCVNFIYIDLINYTKPLKSNDTLVKVRFDTFGENECEVYGADYSDGKFKLETDAIFFSDIVNSNELILEFDYLGNNKLFKFDVSNITLETFPDT